MSKSEAINAEAADLVLSNGDQLFFPKSLKGKHYRAFQGTVATAIKAKQVMNEKTGEIETKADIDDIKYANEVVNAFPYFVDKIISKSGEEIVPTVDYYDNLDFKDASTVYLKLQNLLIEAQTGSGAKKENLKKN